MIKTKKTMTILGLLTIIWGWKWYFIIIIFNNSW